MKVWEKLLLLIVCLNIAGCQQALIKEQKTSHDKVTLHDVSQLSGAILSKNQQAYDIKKVTIFVEPDAKTKTIDAEVQTSLLLLADLNAIEYDFDPRFIIKKVLLNSKPVAYEYADGKLLLKANQTLIKGSTANTKVLYHGKPHVAVKPPWQGGFVWSQTKNKQAWFANAVQTEGCDLWWPCKDHFSDKIEQLDFKIKVKKGLSAAANGVLKQVIENKDGSRVFHWISSNPMSAYHITINVGPFVRIEDTYQNINGVEIPLEFWALKENEDKAIKLIETDVKKHLRFFEKNLGPYPWGNEKIGFVETPHLGMEHQTINAYGLNYKKTIHRFDWLLHHELSHEWFGNLMTHADVTDAWLHEAYAQYMQPLYIQTLLGDSAYQYLMQENFLKINNCKAVVLEKGVSVGQAFHADIYFKGAWFLHMIRNLVGDEVFWQTTRKLVYGSKQTQNLTYPIQTRYRSTQDFINILNQESGQDFSTIVDVFLSHATLPELKSTFVKQGIQFQWHTANGKVLELPVEILLNNKLVTLPMHNGLGILPAKQQDKVVIDPFYKLLMQRQSSQTCSE